MSPQAAAETPVFTPEEERVRRLMVEVSYLYDASHLYYSNCMEKTFKAVELEDREASTRLHMSAMDDIHRAFALFPTIMSALLGNVEAMDRLHDEFVRETSGIPN